MKFKSVKEAKIKNGLTKKFAKDGIYKKSIEENKRIREEEVKKD